MDTATNFSFSNDTPLSNNNSFHFNNINLSDNSNIKSKINNNSSNFSFALNSNLSKENTINNSNNASMYSNFNNMKSNSRPVFLQWRNKQKQKKPRYFRNDINIESEEEEEEEEDEEEEEENSLPEIFNFEDSASFGKQNTNRIMNSSKLSNDITKSSYLFNTLEGKNKDIRCSSTPNINAFFNKTNDRLVGSLGTVGTVGSNLMDTSSHNHVNSLSNINNINNINSINNINNESTKNTHPLMNGLNNSRSTSSLNSVFTNNTNNTISSYTSPMQTDTRSPLSISNKIMSSKPISIPFGSNSSLHSREDDIQMDDAFSNNNQKSLGCNSLLAKMQLDVDNNSSKLKNDTQKLNKKKQFRPINRVRYLLQEESQNFLEKEIEHEAQTTLLLKQTATDISQDVEGKDDINIPYPLYTTLVQNPQVKSPIIYTSSSKLNPENTMLSSRSREIYSLSPSSGSPLTNGNIHNIMVLSPSINRSLKRKMSFEAERFEPYYKRRVSMSGSPVSPRIGSYHDMFISPSLKQNLSASLSSNSSNSIQTGNLFFYGSSPRSATTPQLLNIQGAYGDFSKMSLGVPDNNSNHNHIKTTKSPFSTLSNQNNNNNNNSMNLTNLRTTSNI